MLESKNINRARDLEVQELIGCMPHSAIWNLHAWKVVSRETNTDPECVVVHDQHHHERPNQANNKIPEFQINLRI